MQAAVLTASKVSARTWTGRVLSAIAALFMTMDAVSHLIQPAPVVDAFARLGVPQHLSIPIGVLALVCTALYVIPRTSVLGGLLLTAYLGGATATQVRAGSPAFEVIFPALVGILVWSGLLLRDPRLRSLVSLRG